MRRFHITRKENPKADCNGTLGQVRLLFVIISVVPH